MRANPHLLTGLNKYWIRFFCLAVYSTMYVRDHSRPQLYKAMQISPTDYDKKVLRITNEITKQVFPITLNLDDPRFYECMNQMLALFQKMDVYKARGGLLAKVMVPLLGVRAGLVFARAYFLPVHLQYMHSYFTKRAMNPLLPISILLACLVALPLWQHAFAANASAYQIASSTILATLLSLAILEHIMMVLPFSTDGLWKWGLRS
ncbi:MAG: DUF3623 family protein [Burkholderiaceae bacterium]|nr:DUF3623 family protein [Burkholderiaceae bacterium]